MVVIGNMYGVDEVSGEYDSKVVSDVGETVVEECSGWGTKPEYDVVMDGVGDVSDVSG